MRDYIDRRVTPATWGLPPPRKQAQDSYYVNPRQFIQLIPGKPVVSIQSRLDSSRFNSGSETAENCWSLQV